MKYTITKIVVSVVLMCFFFSGHLIESEDEISGLKTGPLNEEFVKYLQDNELGIARRDFTEDGYPLGLIPSPMDLSHLKTNPEVSVQGFPGAYSSLTKNKLTAVKNQGQCGSCWAFAIMGILESFLLPSETWDFSEQNLIDNHGFARGPCEGGNLWLALAYLTRWEGPLSEADDPYIYLMSLNEPKVKKHVQSAVFIPRRSSSLDNKTIKKAVMDYGAVYTTMCFASACYNPGYTSFYNPGTKEGEHGVVIVGWIDNYSRYNFNDVPPGDGAFIVRNSWGSDWGENGYFYISYYDEFLGTMYESAAFRQVESHENYTRLYEYDTSGCTQTIGYNSPTSWFANIYTAKAKCELKAVGFYALGSVNKYKIYIHREVKQSDPGSGTIAAKKKGKFKFPGYFTVKLKKAVELKKGERFAIVVWMNSRDTGFPVAVEYDIKGFTKKLKAKKGQSFISSDGSSWTDTHRWRAKTNVCLKGFVE